MDIALIPSVSNVGGCKNAYKHALPYKFQQNVDLVELNPNVEPGMIPLLQPVKGIARLQAFSRQGDVILDKVVEIGSPVSGEQKPSQTDALLSEINRKPVKAN